ncbi:MAG TPA: AAA family ATPase [Herpetosiphonaceae bacterium]
MDAVVLIGLQASGKSSFCRERFWRSHVRISLDMLKTRHRERLLLDCCLAMRQAFVVDNTNPSAAERAVYLAAARAAGFAVSGYYFQSRVAECLERNRRRPEADRVPDKGIYGTAARLELPRLAEGFDLLRYVRLGPDGSWIVEEWNDAI